MKNPNSHNLLSIREAACITGKSYRTFCNYIDRRKIEYLQIDHFRVVTQNEIDRIIEENIIAGPKAQLDGYKTIIQAARILNINIHNLKKYVKDERIDNVKKHDIYFIPNEIIAEWFKVPEPRNPNTVEAYYLDAVVIREAAAIMGMCDSSIRNLIDAGQLIAIDGFCRRYVTKDSIRAYIEIQKMIKEL